MRFYIADAFSNTLFGGNPAGVVLLENGQPFPSDETMRKTAAELRYSETAFIRQLDERTFNIRYFTPADEVDLCGHATIASFHCLKEAAVVEAGNIYTNRTLAGNLEIQIGEDSILMDMANPQYLGSIDKEDDIANLYSVMGLKYDRTLTLTPQLISTGLPDIIMPLDTRRTLSAIRPDFKALTELSVKYNVVGVHAFTLDTDDENITAHCRNFAPLYDIDEEAATGTSNGSLTYYLTRNGLCDKNADCLFIQGEAMGRPSVIRSRVTEGENIKVGGSAVILAEGKINL